MVGVVLRIWAAGHLEKHKKLARSGPYRWTRNPLYFGSFLMGAGCSLASSSIWILLLFFALFAAVYFPVMLQEERELSASYGSDYQKYRERVARFIPLPSRWRDSQTRNFSWRRVIQNREYNAVGGLVVVIVFLYLKMVLL